MAAVLDGLGYVHVDRHPSVPSPGPRTVCLFRSDQGSHSPPPLAPFSVTRSFCLILIPSHHNPPSRYLSITTLSLRRWRASVWCMCSFSSSSWDRIFSPLYPSSSHPTPSPGRLPTTHPAVITDSHCAISCLFLNPGNYPSLF